MKKKIVIIGIDGMDKELIKQFKKDLPNIQKIKSLSPNIEIKSTFPPDSETAWASIYSGLNPAEHGILHFIDPLEKSLIYQSKDSDSEGIKGKTVWDFASKNGKRVCIVLPHIGYPVWAVNGIMIGRSSIENDVQSFPSELKEEFDLKALNTIKKFPGVGGISHSEFISAHEKLLEKTKEIGIKLLKKEDWDIFFIYSSVLDVVPHFFWKFHDPNDPAYPGNSNPFKDTLKNLYILHDQFIGKFYGLIDDDTTLIILSDHGHGLRPTKNININELLRQNNLLVENQKKHTANTIEYVKQLGISIITKFNLENYASTLLKSIPLIRENIISSSKIKWEESIAYTSDLSGIKSYPYGGIRINSKISMNKNEYELIREKIIKLILDINQSENKKIVMWIKKREDVYQGPCIDRYPDILFELDEEFGIGNRIHVPLIDSNKLHSIVPGSHKRYNTVCYVMNKKSNKMSNKSIDMEDVSKLILNAIGLEYSR